MGPITSFASKPLPVLCFLITEGRRCYLLPLGDLLWKTSFNCTGLCQSSAVRNLQHALRWWAALTGTSHPFGLCCLQVAISSGVAWISCYTVQFLCSLPTAGTVVNSVGSQQMWSRTLFLYFGAKYNWPAHIDMCGTYKFASHVLTNKKSKFCSHKCSSSVNF